MARQRDTNTLDLFRDFQPAPVVARFGEEVVRAGTLAARLSRAVSQCLRDCGLSREVVARRMSEFLGEDVPVSMLEAYASQAKAGTHQISATRLIALVSVTGDERPLNALLDAAALIAVPSRYEALLKRERAKELKDELERQIAAADAEWRARR
ncbi:hypothetical protein GGR16_001708 [Chelatococcus caeni]|uniref:DNA transposition protein n=1 Tax=Chelatococcus caeni TaxID=1348468 RepID=A0A840BYA7_9HYPH|nr:MULTISPECIES: hypothetical protein [Chelatococcus]MBB4016702.1 hypothetical protein [Chelatococcus caeni]